MNYKAVIEEQIRELQKKQNELANDSTAANEACKVALTIAELCEKSNMFVGEPEKKVAEPEVQVQAQPKEFVPEDSNGPCTRVKCTNEGVL